MTPQELKNSILQLAIQGRLVEQRPEEGTAEELYKLIRQEKQRLIKNRIIKEDKDILDYDEPPYDIPETWLWTKITDCGFFISGFTPSPSELCSNGTIPYFKVSDMNTLGNEIWMSKTDSYLKTASPKKYFLKNTIVYPKNGGAVFTNKKRILAQNSIVDLNTGGYTVFSPIHLQYAYIYFSLIDFKHCYKGTALPTIDMDKLKRYWFPLPPLAEQKRIVAKIEELLPLIDRYEKAWSRLEDFNKRFPDDMQKSILQMAIQGKLIEQRLEEGTGNELYHQIKNNNEEIKADKMKGKGKSDILPINLDDVPFDIPDSWIWVRLGTIGYTNIGLTYSPKDISENGTIVLRSSNIQDFMMDYNDIVRVQMDIPNNKMCNKGDILICARNGSKRLVGKAAIIDRDGMSFGAFVMNISFM